MNEKYRLVVHACRLCLSTIMDVMWCDLALILYVNSLVCPLENAEISDTKVLQMLKASSEKWNHLFYLWK